MSARVNNFPVQANYKGFGTVWIWVQPRHGGEGQGQISGSNTMGA